jgi:hypothetical protein
MNSRRVTFTQILPEQKNGAAPLSEASAPSLSLRRVRRGRVDRVDVHHACQMISASRASTYIDTYLHDIGQIPEVTLPNFSAEAVCGAEEKCSAI